MKWWHWGLIALVVLACVAGAFALAGDDQRQAAGEYEKTPPTSAAEVEERASRCEKVGAAMLRFIESGLNVAESEITESAAVRSADLNRVWLIATRIEGEGFDELAVFATDELGRPGRVLAVDGIAEEFSDWGLADATNGVEVELGDDGTDKALDCID